MSEKEVKKVRYHGMDSLRAIAMLLGIILHGIIVYQVTPPREGFPNDPLNHFIGFDHIYGWIHAFRMPLFFIVAGFFGRFLYLKIQEKAFIKHRIRRIGIPLLIGIVTIVPLSAFPLNYYKYAYLRELSANVAFQKAAFDLVGWNGFFHLWFLYQLMILYFIMVVFNKYLLRLTFINRIFIQNPYNLLNALILILISFLTLLFFYDSTIPPWTPYNGIKPDIGQTLYYGLFFYFGYVIQKRSLIDNVKGLNIILYGVAGTVLYASKFIFTFDIVMEKLIWSGETILLSLSFLGLFNKFLNVKNNLIRYISDASYWLYLAHFPVVSTLQILFLHIAWPLYIELTIILFLTFFITFYTYEHFVRYTLIGDYLNGPRERVKISFKPVFRL